ncbi:cysteine hydrolase [Ornithinimicrobium pratense]|uniref:Cysteine hydrolase n=1 Tax=Ornithinimicrobium pratense TaxID=2593973 RepID=A0A5J6V8Z3_9MICO|nr:cysteine hydrolase [Ornithinimicrobium pratense]
MSLKIDSLDPNTTALLLIDLQNDFVEPGAPLETPMAYQNLPRLKELVSFCRDRGIQLIYTRHAHDADGSDMGLFAQIYPGLGEGAALIEGQRGAQIFDELAPQEGDLMVRKQRYSGFFQTNLDLTLRSNGIRDVAIAGATSEDCCLATARDAMYRGYRVAFLSDATGTYDYPDIGYGPVKAEDLHRTILTVVGVTTGHVMTVEEFQALVSGDSQP